ncbi:MAG TPA: TlpA disulfide reductase family protein [Burkholderiaceae bacterium]|nr:TlpA disulfide reductase family protein [Burkholderiaceae bacterium]
MNRRHLLWGGSAAAAAFGGLGAWFWRARQAPGIDPWSLSFDAPDGGRLALASLRGKPLVLNFWATWCPPCVREMPALDRFHRDFQPKGWQVLGIAADSVDKVRSFLAATPVGFPVAVAGFGGVELSRQLGNASGGLPFTVVFDRRGAVTQRHMGETRYEQLAGWALDNS